MIFLIGISFSKDDGDEYKYQEDEGYEEDFIYQDDEEDRRSSRRNLVAAPSNGQRRSTRTAVVNANGKREAELSDKYSGWRGERRSTRLGAPVELQLDYQPPTKRARTDDSALSTNSSEPDPSHSSGDHPIRVKTSGAAALKPTEFALEEVAGRKKSKFYYYAVEPVPGAASAELSGDNPPLNKDSDAMDVDVPVNGSVSTPASGSHGTNVDSGVDISASPRPHGEVESEFDRSSLSPLSP